MGLEALVCRNSGLAFKDNGRFKSVSEDSQKTLGA
jgi:hypothetical protein